MSDQPETSKDMSNQPPETTEKMLNPPETSEKISNQLETGEKISNQPETGQIMSIELETTMKMLNQLETTVIVSNPPQTTEEMSNQSPETDEIMSNEPEITMKMLNQPETGEKMLLNQPETGEKLPNQTGTGEIMSNQLESGEIMSNPQETTEEASNPPETNEKISNPPEASENKTAPETIMSPLPGSSSLPNMGLTSTPKLPNKTRNRRFREPKKLLIYTNADEVFLSCPDFSTLAPDQEGEGPKDDNEKKAKCMPQAKRLSKFLKLSPAHSWVWYEFGESLVDAAVQRGAYEMGSFMLEYCPQLKTRLLPRRGWQLLRRSLGKARRFSPAFIQAEQQEVERSRHLVRQLQQAKPVKRDDHAFLEQIYRGVSMPLAKNAKVTTFLKGHGIASGVISSFEPEKGTYLVKCVLNSKTVELAVPDILIQSTEEFVGLPLSHLMKAIDPNEDIFKMETITNEQGNYSEELLEAIVEVKRLLVVKAKAVQELAAKNDSQKSAAKPKKGQANSVGSSFMELYRVNNEILPPMRILHEYMRDYNYKVKLQTTRARSALERYLKCCNHAERDLHTMAKKYRLMVMLPIIRGYYLDLQTILYLTGELGCSITDDMMLIMDNLVAYMIKTSHPQFSAQFEITMNELKPLRQLVAEKLKKKPAIPPRFYTGQA